MAHAGAVFVPVPFDLLRGPCAVRDTPSSSQVVENVGEMWKTVQVFNLERRVRFSYGLPSLLFLPGPNPLKFFHLHAPQPGA